MKILEEKAKRPDSGPLAHADGFSSPKAGRFVAELVYCGHDAHRAIVKLSEAVQQTDGRYLCQRCVDHQTGSHDHQCVSGYLTSVNVQATPEESLTVASPPPPVWTVPS